MIKELTKLNKEIEKIDSIIRRMAMVLIIIVGFTATLTQNNILYIITVTLGICAIVNMLILNYIIEKINNLKKEGK